MSKIVSLSFFRHDKSGYETPASGTSQGIFFSNYIRSIVHAFWAVWGGEYTLEIAHDDRVKDKREFKFLLALWSKGLVKLRDCGEAKTLCGSMLWRIDPIFNPEVELLICRDIDSLFMPRDKKMVEAFVASRGTIHGINDSESHSIPLLGGMIAIKGEAFRKHFTSESWNHLKASFDLTEHGSDQKFLNSFVYPKMKDGLITHTRKPTISYECLRSYPALPQEGPIDHVVGHVGAGFDTEKLMQVLEHQIYSHKADIEECWKVTS